MWQSGSLFPIHSPRQKRAPPPIWERRSFNVVIHFSISPCALKSDKVALWLTLWICTLAAPGTAHSRLGNCTKTRRELHNPHGEPQRTTQQRRGTTQKQPGTVENCTTTPGNCTDAAGNCRKPYGNHTAAARDYPEKIIFYVKISCSCFKVRFIGQPACYIQLVAREQHKIPGEPGLLKIIRIGNTMLCFSEPG